MEVKNAPLENIGIIFKDEKGLHQFGMTPEQNLALRSFILEMSKKQPLVKMSEAYDLVLKSKVKKMKE